VADALGELGELAGWLAGLWVWMAPPEQPATPPTTITASTATTTRAALLRGTVLIAGKPPRRYVFSQGTSHYRLTRETNSLLIR